MSQKIKIMYKKIIEWFLNYLTNIVYKLEAFIYGKK